MLLSRCDLRWQVDFLDGFGSRRSKLKHEVLKEVRIIGRSLREASRINRECRGLEVTVIYQTCLEFALFEIIIHNVCFQHCTLTEPSLRQCLNPSKFPPI